LQYRFKTLEYNGLKGVIGEQLARSYIRNRLAAKLIEEEKWDHVILSRNEYKKHTWTWNTKLFKFDYFREDFIIHGFYAKTNLLSKYSSAISILEQNHCTPDGILLKLKDTGKTRRLKEDTYPEVNKLKINRSLKRGEIIKLPIVEGSFEIVEIKCGRKAKLMDKQKRAYNDIIAKGIPLRMIKVRIDSFDLNRFLVEDHKYEKFL
jgi:hypothetical protein